MIRQLYEKPEWKAPNLWSQNKILVVIELIKEVRVGFVGRSGFNYADHKATFFIRDEVFKKKQHQTQKQRAPSFDGKWQYGCLNISKQEATSIILKWELLGIINFFLWDWILCGVSVIYLYKHSKIFYPSCKYELYIYL